jgi:hypothetical protein
MMVLTVAILQQFKWVVPVIHPTIARRDIVARALRAEVACALLRVEQTMIVLTAVAAMAAVVFGPASATRSALGAKPVRKHTPFASISDGRPVNATNLAHQEDSRSQEIQLKIQFGFASPAGMWARVARPCGAGSSRPISLARGARFWTWLSNFCCR